MLSSLIPALTLLACGDPPAPPRVGEPDAAAVPMAPVAEEGLLTEREFAKLHALKPNEAAERNGTDVAVGGSRAYLSLPPGEIRAGVVVIHEWWGLNAHIEHWADRIAGLGYAALAVDLYGGTVASTREEAMAAMKAVDEAQAASILAEAHRYLASEAVGAQKRAVLGWCFGGGWSLRHALATPDLDAAVVYYGRPVTEPEALAPLKAPLLGVFATRDAGIPNASVDGFEQALKAANKDARILRYDAEHAFANPSALHYDFAAAEQAWTEVRGFLKAHLE